MKFLSKFNGDRFLCLNKLENLTLHAASYLSAYRGMFLKLSGIKSTSIEVVKNLSKFRGVLVLGGIEDISEMELELFFGAIKNSRNDSNRNFSMVLPNKIFESGKFDHLIDKYSISIGDSYEFDIGKVKKLS